MAWVSPSTRISIRKKLFCEEYAAEGFKNASAAAKKAGVSAKASASTASQWLDEEDVAGYVKELAEARFYDAKIRSEDLIEELKAVAFGRITDFACIRTVVTPTEEGAEIHHREVVFTAFDQLPDHKLKALSEVGERRTKWGSQVYVRTHSKLDAIKQLREIEGIAAPIKHTVEADVTSYSLKRKHRRNPDE